MHAAKSATTKSLFIEILPGDKRGPEAVKAARFPRRLFLVAMPRLLLLERNIVVGDFGRLCVIVLRRWRTLILVDRSI